MTETRLTEMQVRQATAQDMDRVIAMALRFVRELPFGGALDGVSPATLAPVFNLVLERGACFVTERILTANAGSPVHISQLVGFLAVVALVHPLTGKLYADEIAWWMEPEYRAGVAGPKMLRCAEEWTTRNGLSYLKMVSPSGSSVGRFYERLGYIAVETAYLKNFGNEHSKRTNAAAPTKQAVADEP